MTKCRGASLSGARRGVDLLQRCPWVVLVLLVPSWLAWLTMERDLEDTEHLLFYYIPDLTEKPLAVLLNLFVTPLVNTETGQIILVTVLIGTFGVLVEKRLGALMTLGIFWGTSASGALIGGALLHLLYPLFPDVHAFEQGWNRVFNGASAGGFGLMAAYAAIASRPLLWIALFCLWEAGWLLVSGAYTAAFHIIAFVTGYVAVRTWQVRHAAAAGRDPAGAGASRPAPARRKDKSCRRRST